MLKYIVLILTACLFLSGCPSNTGYVPTPIPIPLPEPDPVVINLDDDIITPHPDPDFLPQRCKLEWEAEVSFDNYDALIEHLIEQLANSTCTADSILCIYVGVDSNCFKIWEFPTIDSIPRHTITDECGNNVIHYRGDDL